MGKTPKRNSIKNTKFTKTKTKNTNIITKKSTKKSSTSKGSKIPTTVTTTKIIIIIITMATTAHLVALIQQIQNIKHSTNKSINNNVDCLGKTPLLNISPIITFTKTIQTSMALGVHLSKATGNQ